MTGTEASDGRTAGRHGGDSGGLSAAELIARSRAAAGDAPPRPSRRARQAEDPPPLTLAQPPVPDVAEQPLPVPPPVRHLSVVAAPAERSPGAATVSPPRTPRAGRDLPAAIGVGVALGALIVATL